MNILIGGRDYIGASVYTYICMYVLVASLRPYTINFKMSAFKYFTKTWIFLQLMVKTRILQERSITVKEILTEDDSS